MKIDKNNNVKNHFVDDNNGVDDNSVNGVEDKNNQTLDNIKKAFIYIMVGGLIVSAIISIVAVLIGSFDELISKALFTTMSAVLHSIVALGFISIGYRLKSKISNTVQNILFFITIASFITSFIGIWEVLTGLIIMRLYLTYLFAVIAALLCLALSQSSQADSRTRMSANSSMAITIFMFFLLMPFVYMGDQSLPELYYRSIAAVAILLGTTSTLTAIFDRLYRSKNPELEVVAVEKADQEHFNIFRVIGLLFVIFILISIGFAVISFLL